MIGDAGAKQTQTGLFFLAIACVFIIGGFVQNDAIFSWDVSWLLEVTKRWLNGGTYGKDFFENNPPLILYLYAPAVLGAKLFHSKQFLKKKQHYEN
jgi:hypothetical protein